MSATTTLAVYGADVSISTTIGDTHQIPSVEGIKQWVEQFAVENDMYWHRVRGDPYDFVQPEIRDWFISTQRDAWVKSGRPFTTYQELVFGKRNPTATYLTNLSYGLHYYYEHKFGTTNWHQQSTFWKNRDVPDMPESYNQDVRRHFPGMPAHFIAVCHNYFLEMGARFPAFPFVTISRNAILAFLMICYRANLPNEIIHQILLNLKINTYTGKNTSGGDIKFLDSGDDFKKATLFFHRDITGQQHRDINWYDIIQMTKAFWQN